MPPARPSVFDALCSHIDELEQLPPGAEVLAQNELCPIQALAVELPSGSVLFGTQYHPEFTLLVAAGLIEMRAASLVVEGFGRDCAELVAMARDFRTLHAEPERRDLAWRYGIGPEILDPARRTTEIGNWLREAAKISSS
jgi:GMP synthase (glutamine-hydrolysing)